MKLTLPSKDGFYDELLNNKNVIKLSFLSGGYSKDKAIGKLSKNKGIACFSRALLEGITCDLSEEEFNSVLQENIDQIWRKKCE